MRSWSSARTSSPPRRARASCTWRPGSARTTRPPAPPPASRWSARSTTGARFTSEVPDLRGPAGVRRQPAGHPGPAPAGDAGPLRLVRSRLPALLADRHAPGVPGRDLVVREGDRHQGPPAGAQPGDHLGARARPGRVVRQVAGQCPGLVDLPQPVLGLADPGLEERRSALPPSRRVRQPRRAGARLRRAARPTCTGPPSTS